MVVLGAGPSPSSGVSEALAESAVGLFAPRLRSGRSATREAFAAGRLLDAAGPALAVERFAVRDLEVRAPPSGEEAPPAAGFASPAGLLSAGESPPVVGIRPIGETVAPA